MPGWNLGGERDALDRHLNGLDRDRRAVDGHRRKLSLAFAELQQRRGEQGLVRIREVAGDLGSEDGAPLLDFIRRYSNPPEPEPEPEPLPNPLIFIIHSSDDQRLATALGSLLRGALDVGRHRDPVRCTSDPCYKSRSGHLPGPVLRKEIGKAGLVIGLLTPCALGSAWVLFEMGAAWGLERWLCPLLVGLEHGRLPGPLAGQVARRGHVRADVVHLLAETEERLGIEPADTRDRDAAVTAFLECVQEAGAR